MHCPFGSSPCPKGATAYQPGVEPRVSNTSADAFRRNAAWAELVPEGEKEIEARWSTTEWLQVDRASFPMTLFAPVRTRWMRAAGNWGSIQLSII